MQQEGATLSAILDTRNESAANDSSFPPLSAFVPSRYTVSLIRTGATRARILVTPFLPPSVLPQRRGTIVSRASHCSPLIDEWRRRCLEKAARNRD